MAAKKGKIPAHVKKEFSHPNAQHSIIYIFDGQTERRTAEKTQISVEFIYLMPGALLTVFA